MRENFLPCSRATPQTHAHNCSSYVHILTTKACTYTHVGALFSSRTCLNRRSAYNYHSQFSRPGGHLEWLCLLCGSLVFTGCTWAGRHWVVFSLNWDLFMVDMSSILNFFLLMLLTYSACRRGRH